MSGWQDVMDQQLDLYRFWRSELGSASAEMFAESMRRALQGSQVPETTTPQFTENIALAEASKMFLADPIYVDPEMNDLVRAAAETFAPEPLHEHDLITPIGFVVLPEPFIMIDRSDERVSFRAFSWMPIIGPPDEDGYSKQHGIHLSLYTHADDVLAGKDDWLQTSTGIYGSGATDWTPELFRETVARFGTPYALAHLTPWYFEMDLPGTERTYAAQWWRPVQAFLRLAQQPLLAHRYQQQPPRASRKRWERQGGKPKEDRYMTVIRLRRPRSNREGEPTQVEWQHRWIVNGFWRDQWYPSLKMHRQIWISSYVKGPEDKPLLIRKGRAFELVQ